MTRASVRRGTPSPGPRTGLLYSADLSLLDLSTATNATALRAALADRGLTLTRASSATVQTSASTIVSSGIGVDDPRIGDAGYGRGLVIEESRTNQVKDCRDESTANWNAGTGTTTYDVDAGPDGSTLADRSVCNQNKYGRYQTPSISAATAYTVSLWVRRGVIGVAGSNGLSLSDGINTGSLESTLTDAWTRVSTAFTSAAGASALTTAPVEGRGVYGLTQKARDTVLDLLQVEAGKFATEAIVTGGAASTRSADRLACSVTPAIVRGGRIGLAMRVILKGSIGGASLYAADPYLWRYDANNYASINLTTGAVTVVIAGNSYTTASGFTAAVGDIVDYWVEAGGGALMTMVKARKNGGAVTTLGTSVAAQGTHPNSASMDLLSNAGTSNHLSAWLQSVQAYAPGRRPSWAS